MIQHSYPCDNSPTGLDEARVLTFFLNTDLQFTSSEFQRQLLKKKTWEKARKLRADADGDARNDRERRSRVRARGGGRGGGGEA